jgi:hypothetical protein
VDNWFSAVIDRIGNDEKPTADAQSCEIKRLKSKEANHGRVLVHAREEVGGYGACPESDISKQKWGRFLQF